MSESNSVIESDWFGLYKEKWAGLIHPDAIAHPAKFARALIRQIYQHAIDEEWLHPGDRVLDCFGGVALGAHDAMRHGLHWTGCELESKFVSLGNQNITLWNDSFAGKMPVWGTAQLIQGDSRKLSEVLAQASADLSRSSPPFSPPGNQPNKVNGGSQGVRASYPDGQSPDEGYSESLDNLGNLRMVDGDLAAVITSPPYAESLSSEKNGIDWSKCKPDYEGRVMHDERVALNQKHHTERRYSSDSANLGNLRASDGDHAAIISSPPWETSADAQRTCTAKGTKARQATSERGSYQPKYASAISSPPFCGSHGEDKHYGILKHLDDCKCNFCKKNAGNAGAIQGYKENHKDASTGQVGAMREGDFSTVIASPPFVESLASDEPQKRGGLFRDTKRANDKTLTATYGETEGQLGVMKAGAIVTSPPYEGSLDRGVIDKNTRRQWARDHGISNAERVSPIDMDAQRTQEYGATAGQLGNSTGDTFWSASKTILEQCYQVLAPGAHAIFVVKGFVRKKQYVDFPAQWAALCEAVGFKLIHYHRSWLIEPKGVQHRLDGGEDDLSIARKSFFRLLAERKGSPKIDFEVALCFERV